MLRAIPREVVRFALVGVSNTVVSMGVYALLLALGVPYAPAVAVAYLAGMLNGYTWNRRWTFSAGRFSVGSLSRYAVVQGCGLLLSVGLTALFVEVAGVAELPALVLSWPPVIAVTFTATRYWVFAGAAAPTRP